MATPLLPFNRQQFADDLAARGLNQTTFANASGVNRVTILRFLKTGQCHEVTMARMAYSLGYKLERYVPRDRARALAARPKVLRAPAWSEMARQLREQKANGVPEAPIGRETSSTP